MRAHVCKVYERHVWGGKTVFALEGLRRIRRGCVGELYCQAAVAVFNERICCDADWVPVLQLRVRSRSLMDARPVNFSESRLPPGSLGPSAGKEELRCAGACHGSKIRGRFEGQYHPHLHNGSIGLACSCSHACIYFLDSCHEFECNRFLFRPPLLCSLAAL